MLTSEEAVTYAPHLARPAGIETEYGVASYKNNVQVNYEPVGDYARAFMQLAKTPWLGHFSKLGRFYIDSGSHLEFCTNEYTDYKLLALAKVGGDELLVRALQHSLRTKPNPMHAADEILLPLRSTDERGNMWGGMHANMAIPRSVFEEIFEGVPEVHPSPKLQQLATYLVASSVVMGNGHVKEDGAHRHQLHPFERLHGFYYVASLNTTYHRPIINARDEPHGSSRHHARLHTIALDVHTRPLTTAVQLGCLSAMLRSLELDKPIPYTFKNILPALYALRYDPYQPIEVVDQQGTETQMTAFELFHAIAAHLGTLATQEGTPQQEQAAIQTAQTAVEDYLQGNTQTKQVKTAMPWVERQSYLETTQLLHRPLSEQEAKDLAAHNRMFDSITVRADEVVMGAYLQAVRKPAVLQKAIEVVWQPPTDTRAALRAEFIQRYAQQTKEQGRTASCWWEFGKTCAESVGKTVGWYSKHPTHAQAYGWQPQSLVA